MLRTWVLSGPREGDGLIGWLLGMWLWWRMWSVIILGGLLPLAVGLWVYLNISQIGAILATWFATSIMEPHVMKINPKWNLEKNY